MSESRARPFLRWAGSKRQLASVLGSRWKAEHSRYVEPFCGSGAVFFALHPQRALLSDLNPAVIDTYVAVRDDHASVSTHLDAWGATAEAYYEIRSRNPEELDAAERAARMVYLMRFCYGGIYRTNSSGVFNTPYGGGRTGSLPSKIDLCAAAAALADVELQCGDFETILTSEAKQGDFVYMDPPYAATGEREMNHYGTGSFRSTDLSRTATLLRELDGRGCSFVLSYADTAEAIEAFSEWVIDRVEVRRLVAASASKRRCATEIIVSNAALRDTACA